MYANNVIYFEMILFNYYLSNYFKLNVYVFVDANVNLRICEQININLIV